MGGECSTAEAKGRIERRLARCNRGGPAKTVERRGCNPVHYCGRESTVRVGARCSAAPPVAADAWEAPEGGGARGREALRVHLEGAPCPPRGSAPTPNSLDACVRESEYLCFRLTQHGASVGVSVGVSGRAWAWVPSMDCVIAWGICTHVMCGTSGVLIVCVRVCECVSMIVVGARTRFPERE